MKKILKLKNNMHIGGHGFNHLKLGELNAEKLKKLRKHQIFKKIYGKKRTRNVLSIWKL